MTAAGGLLEWLAVPRDAPIEECGVTAAIAALSGAEITAVMHSRAPRWLDGRERQLLQALAATTGHERQGVLLAGGVPAVATTSVLLPGRLPGAVRTVLGIGPGGEALPGTSRVPLGRALAGLGARREPLQVVAGTERDAGGREVAIRSVARLWLPGYPVALVTELIYAGFLDRYPAR